MATIRPEEPEPVERIETTGVRRVYEERPPAPERRSRKAMAGGSLAEGLGGAAAVILAIIGLAGSLPRYMAAVATIAIGVAFIAQGGTVAARWSALRESAGGVEHATTEFGAGMSAELLGGAAGIVLGILALIGLVPNLLLPVALLVFGGTLLLSSASEYDLGRMGGGYDARWATIVRDVAAGAAGMNLLVGVAAVVLGIIALLAPRAAGMTVTLVGLLVVGAAILLAGAAIGTRVFARARH
jgi:hypothetical protein